MKAIATLALGLCAALFFHAEARAADSAGDLDHLVCFKMRDSMTKSARLDLRARLRAEFSAPGCKLDLDKKNLEANAEYCVPASSRNVEADDHDPNVVGAPMSDDLICYRVECRATGKPPQHVVTDPFGSRTVAFVKAARICVPASKAPVPCGQVGKDKGAAVCGGACPAGTACRTDGKKKADCACLPVPCGGAADGADTCGGTCASAADECRANVGGACTCQPRGCGLDPASGQCGGPCAEAGEECLPTTGGGCECSAPASGGCGYDADEDMCGGDCPEGLFCLPPLEGGDTCVCRTSGILF